MFNKLQTIKKFKDEIISIENLYEMVKNNTQEDIINNIRSVKYKSKEYNNLKLKVNAITPHGIFSSLKNEGLIKLSGYLYYDIDGFETNFELNDTIDKLLNEGCISFLCKSVGGKGISFMVKIDETNFELNETNFLDVYSYIRKIFIDKGYNIDLSASGLVRKMIISSDVNVYLNDKVSLPIDVVSFKNYKESLNNLRKLEGEERIGIKGNDTFSNYKFNLINKEDLNIIEETKYDISDDYNIEEIEYYKIYLPKEIKDGDKHRLYVRIMNALYYLNKNITMNEVYSYLYYINEKSNNKMNDFYLRKYVYNICNCIVKNGVRIKLRNKKIHISDKYSKKEKEIMGGKINGKIRQNESIRLIEEARMKCASMNEMPTQKRIQEMTGLGIATVKRNWNKEYNDLTDIKVNNIEEKNEEILLERENKLNEILDLREEDFFNNGFDIIEKKVQEDEDMKFWEDWKPKQRVIEKEFIDTDFGDGIQIDDFIEGGID